MILLLAALVWLAAVLVIIARATMRVSSECRSGMRLSAPGDGQGTPSGVVAVKWQIRTKPGTLSLLLHDTCLRDVLALGAVGAATLLFFWRLISGEVWMPAGGGDLAQFLFPTYHFAAEWWRQGIIPLWNPYLFAGMPFVGDIQSGIFYPLNLLTFFLSNPLTFGDLEYLSVLHFAVAGTGMYAFLRWGKLEIGDWRSEVSDTPHQQVSSQAPISIAAALAGAIAFEFSDVFITHFGNLNLIAVAAWTPLVLLFYRRGVRDRRPFFAVLAGIVLAIAFFAGHIQAFLFIVLAVVLWAAYEMICRWRSSPVLPLGTLAITALIAFGLAAPSLLPNLEMTQFTLRADYSYEQAAQFSLPPAQLVGLFVPGFFGRAPQNAWAPWPRVEVGYIGIFPLILALLAIVLRRDRLTQFLSLAALLGLVLALGGYSTLHGWLYQFVPGMAQLRAPARFIFLFDFATAALAALGFDLLLHALPRAAANAYKRIVRVAPWVFLLVTLATGSTAFAMLALGQGQDPVLFNRLATATNALAFFILLLGIALALVVARGSRFFRPKAWAGLALALIFFDLFSLGAYVDVTASDPSRAYAHPEAVTFLKAEAGLARIDARGTGVDATWSADTGILYGLYAIDGDNPLVLADYERYWQSLGSRSTPLYDLLNVRFLIGRKNVPLDRSKFALAFADDPAVEIHENRSHMPRAMIVYDRRPATNHAAALDAIHASDFDPLASVVLEGESGEQRTQRTEAGKSTSMIDVPPAAKITGYGPNEIVVQTSSGGDGVLVLSEVYYPGWRAWVDSSEAPVLRANYLFRAVELPAGEHRVRLLYDPWSFKIGAGLFAVTMAGLVAWGLVRRVRPRERSRHGDQKQAAAEHSPAP